MEKEIIELVEKCKLVHKKSIADGHDCWGKTEFTTTKHVFINGKEKECFDGWYVIHNGKEVKEVCTKFLLDCRKREKLHLEKTGWRTPAEYNAYLRGLNDNKLNIIKHRKEF